MQQETPGMSPAALETAQRKVDAVPRLGQLLRNG